MTVDRGDRGVYKGTSQRRYAMTPYTVTIYKSLAGRFCVRHPKGTIHSKDFASLSYARKFCKRQGWEVAA